MEIREVVSENVSYESFIAPLRMDGRVGKRKRNTVISSTCDNSVLLSGMLEDVRGELGDTNAEEEGEPSSKRVKIGPLDDQFAVKDIEDMLKNDLIGMGMGSVTKKCKPELARRTGKGKADNTSIIVIEDDDDHWDYDNPTSAVRLMKVHNTSDEDVRPTVT